MLKNIVSQNPRKFRRGSGKLKITNSIFGIVNIDLKCFAIAAFQVLIHNMKMRFMKSSRRGTDIVIDTLVQLRTVYKNAKKVNIDLLLTALRNDLDIDVNYDDAIFIVQNIMYRLFYKDESLYGIIRKCMNCGRIKYSHNFTVLVDYRVLKNNKGKIIDCNWL